MGCLREIEAHTVRGSYAAGFLSYEAAAAMDGALQVHPPKEVPLLWFGIYDRFEDFGPPTSSPDAFHMDPWNPSVSTRNYRKAIAQIKQYIRHGDTYQVNYTLRLNSMFRGDPWDFFVSLHQAQRSDYSAYIHLGRHHICCVSPELFFSLQSGRITCKPMKGTAKRGYTLAEDRQLEQWLALSTKNRAENVMIVDMIRNDLGRISETGSVRVEKLFSVEKYPTVLQMTSTITSRVSVPLSEIFRQMFPCASITGAPKVKTMGIIRHLETDARGIYTGTIGYVSPDSRGQFNVAIRTAVIDTQAHRAEYGVGSGIVWNSNADSEYKECQTKARVLRHEHVDFDLLETVLWTPDGGFYLLELHLGRLRDSAEYFRFRLSVEHVLEKLRNFALTAQHGRQKVRITLARCGKVTVESSPVISIRGATIAIARQPIQQQSPFLYHKTTCRNIYSNLLKEHRSRQANTSDLIAWNETRNITESCIANVVIDYGGQLLTPPVNQGLLPGVFRQSLLQQGIIKEKKIAIDHLLKARATFLVNSVRGWMPLQKSSTADMWIVHSDFNYAPPQL